MNFLKSMFSGKKNPEDAPSKLQQQQQQQVQPAQQIQQTQQVQQVPQQQQRRGPSNKINLKVQEDKARYDDDEKPIEVVKQEFKEAKIDIEIKAQRTMVKLKEKTVLPAMCSLIASGGTRSSVDLICVLDVSGSMSGTKIELLKETMRFLIETLTPSDRMSIVAFSSSARRVVGLKCVSKDNLLHLNNCVNQLTAGGGTNITAGMDVAFKIMREREYKNQVTSVFLLSDGQASMNTIQMIGQNLKIGENQKINTFTIHSFGFGNDHNEDLMSGIAALQDGNFFFIEDLSVLDEAFCSALGSIISVVANDTLISVNNISKGIMEGVKITTVFGEMWKKTNDKEYTIKILQLMSGVRKDYVLELEIPFIDKAIDDVDRHHDVLETLFTAKGLKGENMTGQATLKLTLLNTEEEIPEINENVEVIENYLRVKAAAQIDNAMKMAEQNRHEEAQTNIDRAIQAIEGNKRARKDKVDHLTRDLRDARRQCQKEEFQQGGRKMMTNARRAHERQEVNLMSDCYQNKVQTDMLTQVRMKKRK